MEILARLHHRHAPDSEEVPAVRWERLKNGEVSAIRNSLARHFAPATANKTLSLLRGVLRACRDLGLMSNADCDAAVKVPNIEATWQPPTINLLTERDVRRLFESCSARRGNAGRRDAALLAIFLSTGLRRAEAAMLDIGDIGPHAKSIRIRSSRRAGEYRDAPLGPSARKCISDWTTALDEELDAGDARPSASMPLLLAVNKSGRVADRRLTDQAIYNMIRSIGIDAGLSQVTSRALRLTSVVNLIARGLPIERVQELVGHASWVTTQAYQDLAQRAARDGFEPFEIPYIPVRLTDRKLGKRTSRGGKR